MAMRQAKEQEEGASGLKATIDSVFGGYEWKNIVEIEDSDARGEAAVHILKKNIGAQWATYVRMLGDNNKTRYFLVHLTDHEAGRDLMKEVVWKCCPENGYYVRKTDNPNQQYLIKPEPDLKPLTSWLVDKLREKCYTWNELKEVLREKIWLPKHLWQVIRDLKSRNQIVAGDYVGRFSQKSNPSFQLRDA